MNKLFALWQNEMLKIFRRVSSIVLLILVAAAPFGIGGILKLSEVMNQHYYSYADDYANNTVDQLQKDISAKEIELQTAPPEDAQSLKDELASLYREFYYNELDAQYSVSSSNSGSFRENVMSLLSDAKAKLKVPDSSVLDNLPAVDQLEAYAQKLEQILKDSDYKAYCELKKSEIDANKDFSAEEKTIYKASYDYYLAADPTGSDTGYILSSTISTVESCKLQLLNGVYTSEDGISRPLADAQRTELQNNLAVAVYKLEHNMVKPSTDLSSGISMSSSFSNAALQSAFTFVIIMLIILAGSTISSEISSGSIKSLIISPTRRWKIFAAKFLALLSALVIAATIGFIASLVSGYVYFGADTFSPYVYASAGTAHEIAGIAYLALQFLVELIPAFLVAVFALMLSAVTRNTAASVGISMAVYFGGSMVMQILQLMGLSGEWIKFVPFTNMDNLQTQFFPFSTVSQMVSDIGINLSVPKLGFSLCYLAVLSVCMIYTAFDSFTRRDI